ncbi:MAG TPA: PPC domain-containing protein [Gemmatimonadales bacterium]|nr:PPC domain-containing protein [Gemmatimonadales bacterium]
MRRALLLAGVLAVSATACSEEVPTEPARLGPALLVAPANDDFDAAVEVTGVPFTYTENVGNATVAADDPVGTGAEEQGCFADGQTVWFKFTATENARLTANTIGSSYDTELWLLTGTRGDLTILDCNDAVPGGGHPRTSALTFNAVAGQTYYFMVAQTAVFIQPDDELVFNLVPVVQVDVTLDRVGHVSPREQTGTLTGTVTCSRPSFVELSLSVTQHHERAVGEAFNSFNCNGVTPWEAELSVFEGRFTGGPIEVNGGGLFYASSGELMNSAASATVLLRGGR